MTVVISQAGIRKTPKIMLWFHNSVFLHRKLKLVAGNRSQSIRYMLPRRSSSSEAIITINHRLVKRNVLHEFYLYQSTSLEVTKGRTIFFIYIDMLIFMVISHMVQECRDLIYIPISILYKPMEI